MIGAMPLVFADRARRRRPARARPARAGARDRLRRRRGGAVPGPRVPAARVRGVDASAEAIREAVARIGLDPEGRVAFKQGRSRALPFPDDFFDLVAQAGGTPAPGEIARVLRPGGHLVLVGDVALAGLAPRAAAASSRSRAARPRASASTSCGSGAGEPAARIGCRTAMRVDGMPLALLVNPASAHGRTLKLLPRVEQALDARRIAFRVERTTRPRARGRAGAARGRGRSRSRS